MKINIFVSPGLNYQILLDRNHMHRKGRWDTGPQDTGPQDTGAMDMGPEDIGSKDTGPRDVGTAGQWTQGPGDGGRAGPRNPLLFQT